MRPPRCCHHLLDMYLPSCPPGLSSSLLGPSMGSCLCVPPILPIHFLSGRHPQGTHHQAPPSSMPVWVNETPSSQAPSETPRHPFPLLQSPTSKISDGPTSLTCRDHGLPSVCLHTTCPRTTQSASTLAFWQLPWSLLCSTSTVNLLKHTPAFSSLVSAALQGTCPSRTGLLLLPCWSLLLTLVSLDSDTCRAP